MRLWIALILAGVVSPQAAATVQVDAAAREAYESARKDYYRLKRDASRRKFRHHWLSVAHHFEAVASKYPKSRRAPDALFTSGELLQELSRISGLREDLEAAVGDYRRLCDHYPGHHLADDSALALGRIYFERLAQPEAARSALAQGIRRNPKGDRLPELRSLLASVDKELAKRSDPSRPSLPRKPGPPRVAPQAGPKPPDVERAAADGELESVPPKPVEVSLGPGSKRSKLRARRVVIDAGHGGHDTGAIGRGGTLEKDVSLAVARRLERILTHAGLQATLTRSDDAFLRLEDRARLANAAQGDLFVSIHCNSAFSPHLRGVETYTLNTSSDRYAIRLAARENASSEKQISNLQFILADLSTKADADESLRLAQRVQQSLVRHLQAKHKDIRDLGTKQALFYVLLGVKMPAILVETSFLSNREEERRLRTRAYQDEVAAAIASGISEFVGDHQRLAKRD